MSTRVTLQVISSLRRQPPSDLALWFLLGEAANTASQKEEKRQCFRKFEGCSERIVYACLCVCERETIYMLRSIYRVITD